jgi:hypothetical protein
VTDGILRWGVKQSFREYVRAIDDGSEDTSAPAYMQNGEFCFPQSEGDGGLCFTGRATLSAYRGMLGVTIIDPRIEAYNNALVLSIVEPTSRSVPPSRRIVCTLTPRESTAADEQILDAHLTDAGTVLFDDVYQPGTRMDPVTVVGADLTVLVASSARP